MLGGSPKQPWLLQWHPRGSTRGIALCPWLLHLWGWGVLPILVCRCCCSCRREESLGCLLSSLMCSKLLGCVEDDVGWGLCAVRLQLAGLLGLIRKLLWSKAWEALLIQDAIGFILQQMGVSVHARHGLQGMIGCLT